MTYQCSKCKRRWQQPVGTCPYCLIPIEEMETGAMEDIVYSKVSIPSLSHQTVPYFVKIVSDGKGNLFPLKADRLESSIGSSPDSVAICRIKYDFAEALDNIFRLLGIFFKESQTVLLIPTLNSPDYSYLKENTSPELLEAMIGFLLKKKLNIKVAAQSFGDLPIEVLAKKTGLLDICLERGIAPLDLSKSEFVKKDGLEISDEVLRADLVINLSMLKAGQASATESAFKVLKKENYEGLKYLQSEKELAFKLHGALGKMVTIGDGEAVRRKNGIVSYLGLFFGGLNFLEVDALFNKAVMAEKIPEMIKDIDPGGIATSGRTIKEVEKNIEI